MIPASSGRPGPGESSTASGRRSIAWASSPAEGGRRINIADLQEPPEAAEPQEEPRAETAETAEPQAEAPAAPAEDPAQAAPPAEEEPAIEHEIVPEVEAERV